MVRGIDTFKEFFKGFEDNYVITLIPQHYNLTLFISS